MTKFAAECSHRLFDADAFGHLAYLGRGALFVGKEVGHSVDIRLGRGRVLWGHCPVRNCRAEHRRRVSWRRRGRYPVRRALPVGRARLRSLRRCFFSCASTDLRRAGSCGRSGGKVGLELLQLVLLFPDFPDDLFQDGDFLLDVGIVPRVFLYQAGDAVKGVDEIPAGGLRVGCQASVVVVVQELARAAHEEAVLAEVQSLLDGGVGLDHDVEAIESEPMTFG